MVNTRPGQPNIRDQERWGLWLIPLAGILCALVFTYWMTAPVADDEPGEYADWTVSAAGLTSGILYLVGFLALIFGVMALYSVLSRIVPGVLPLAGLILTVISVTLLMAALGSAILAGAVVADLYRDGDTGVEQAMVKLSGGEFGSAIMAAFIVALVAGLIGAIAYGVAIWRAGRLPKWAGVLFALGFVLFATTAPVTTHVGGILLAAAGIWIVRSLGRVSEAAGPAAVEPRLAS